MWIYRLLLVGCSLGLTGCGLWNPTPPSSPPSELPPLRPATGSATLDIAFIRVPADDPLVAELWQDLDEQHLDAQLRRRLAENGIRCGTAGPTLPSRLEQLIRTANQIEAQRTGLAQGVTIRRLQFSAGNARQLAVSDTFDELTVLQNNGQSVSGNTYQLAQCLWNLRCDQLSGQRVELEMVPEIHHGQPRRHFGGSQGAIQFIVRKDKTSFSDLAITTGLAAGQMLILSSTTEPKGLGVPFFTQVEDGKRQLKLLLISVQQAPADSLFPTATTSPLPLADDWMKDEG